MLLPNFYHPFFLYCVKTPTNDDGNFGELEFLCTFVAKSKPLSKTRQSIANRTVSKSLPEHQPIVRNTLLQRVVAFLSKVTENIWIKKDICKQLVCVLMVFFLHSFLFAVMWLKRHSIFLKSSGFSIVLGKIEPYILYSTLFFGNFIFSKTSLLCLPFGCFPEPYTYVGWCVGCSIRPDGVCMVPP